MRTNERALVVAGRRVAPFPPARRVGSPARRKLLQKPTTNTASESTAKQLLRVLSPYGRIINDVWNVRGESPLRTPRSGLRKDENECPTDRAPITSMHCRPVVAKSIINTTLRAIDPHWSRAAQLRRQQRHQPARPIHCDSSNAPETFYISVSTERADNIKATITGRHDYVAVGGSHKPNRAIVGRRPVLRSSRHWCT